MRFLVIGLGIYGANLSCDLAALGHEVIGADISGSLVDSIKDYISTAYIIDSTDEASLSVLPIKNVDIVIVAIGENFGASIKTVALLKKMEVKRIYARAIDSLHESILQVIGVERILKPEQRAAHDLVNEMSLGGSVTSLRIDQDHFILKFQAPDFLYGERYADLNLEKKYNLKLIAVTRAVNVQNIIGAAHSEERVFDFNNMPEATVEKNDIWTCAGTVKAFHSISKI